MKTDFDGRITGCELKRVAAMLEDDEVVIEVNKYADWENVNGIVPRIEYEARFSEPLAKLFGIHEWLEKGL